MKFPDLFRKRFSKEEAARLLKMRPEAMEAFEKAYGAAALLEEDDNFFKINSRQAAEKVTENAGNVDIPGIKDRIVAELLAASGHFALPDGTRPVTNDEIQALPEGLRPQLTGTMMKVDLCGESYMVVLEMLSRFYKTGDRHYYHMFRQGLDTLDLDGIMYEILGMNRNSMGYWLPPLEAAAKKEGFFKVPETKILKIPLPVLQLTRCDYFGLTPTTLDIVNRWAYEAFGLDENKTYFIKTGTYSSKYDFRNAKVTSPKEVREIGSYLLFIHFQALQMASPLASPSIYGVSTTNEWVVREYIEDVEGNPCIYHGMPLHTEYRVFIDCDTKEVIGIAPYWEPDTMKRRFSKGDDADTADMTHDYIIYLAHEETLMGRYEKNKEKVLRHAEALLPYLALSGQWSLDVMQNGSDFWLIDMADAASSALSEYITKGKLKKTEENWVPAIAEKE